MSWTAPGIGFNFRLTAIYVTDGTDETYVLGSETYPTTRSINGTSVTFGWESVAEDTNGARNRTTGSPQTPKLSGLHQIGSGDASAEAVFRVDLPNTGSFDVRLAAGDAGGNTQSTFWEIRDTASVLFSKSETVVAANHYSDASGTDRADATTWLASNAAVTGTFATSIFRFAMKRPTTNGMVLCHLSIKSNGGAPGSVPRNNPRLTGGMRDLSGGMS